MPISGDWEYGIHDNERCTITKYNGSAGDIVIPDTINGYNVAGIWRTSPGVFNYNIGSSTITFPNTSYFKEIGNNVCTWCRNMHGNLTIPENVTKIGMDAFNSCGFTGPLIIPENVRNIYSQAFFDCSGFTSLTLPDNTIISNSAFAGCSGMRGTLKIPQSMTDILSATFSNTGFDEVIFPEGIRYIRDNAFNNCTNLKTIELPETITRIEGYAFNGCTGVTEIVFKCQQAPYMGNNSKAFALGTAQKHVTAVVYSPNNWASTVLNNHKNIYTSFIFKKLVQPRTIRLGAETKIYGKRTNLDTGNEEKTAIIDTNFAFLNGNALNVDKTALFSQGIFVAPKDADSINNFSFMSIPKMGNLLVGETAIGVVENDSAVPVAKFNEDTAEIYKPFHIYDTTTLQNSELHGKILATDSNGVISPTDSIFPSDIGRKVEQYVLVSNGSSTVTTISHSLGDMPSSVLLYIKNETTSEWESFTADVSATSSQIKVTLSEPLPSGTNYLIKALI